MEGDWHLWALGMGKPKDTAELGSSKRVCTNIFSGNAFLLLLRSRTFM